MNEIARKLLGPALTLLLLGGVATGIWYSVGARQEENHRSGIETVRGLSGSEKLPFLQDTRVLARLESLGIRLEAQKAGSRAIALNRELKEFDYAYPAGVPAASRLRHEQRVNQTFATFFTPMAVASWKPLVDVLEANGIVKKRGNAWHIVDLEKLLAWMAEGKRWRDIPGNTQYPVGKSVLVSTTDLRTSNSAAMYLALLSYLVNERSVVQDNEQAQRALEALSPLFLRQGYQESSTAGPFADYVAMGMGKAPLVLVYESQYIAHMVSAPKGSRNADMVLLYPEPTIFTKHVLVPFNEKGARLGALLAGDPDLQRLAVEYGYRVNDPRLFTDINRARGIDLPDNLLDVIDPPSYELMEKMITGIEQKMSQ